ncbi:CHASE2 domain-containing protein [Sideroxydans lithotrophicus]|uniref:Putative Chase2 sensor protein n=1 Tax=Sideroxydans lithotrophicus (strain ES-1) TaxID=580332 RepID=D5CLU3_SIDLE|nr:CHASE2 domain-containing protein [Sideroxydans lithotrophicus]ADE12538.1 putative Chase2 sensor protein [Sideroxydans lithotrophicus ES-1]
MNLRLFLLSRFRFAFEAFSNLLARRWKRNFYLYLAVLFTVFAVLDTAFLHITSEMRTAAFDAMVRHRLAPPKPDPDIVIADIDEASLAAMAKDYGRWPWPRQVLGEFLEGVEKQKPKAVVFDILFSDADVFNPDSDTYFDAAIAATGNTFFPMLRLDPASDALSEVRVAQIPGVTALPDAEVNRDATIGVVLPHFQSALAGGRLGTHNVYPDADGVVRSYPVFIAKDGWRIPSLPSRIGREFGWPTPTTERMLLNWRGMPFSYHYVSLADVFADMGSKNKQRPQDEFKDKIVIIGSTASGLFDLRATPMARLHPGVEVLATAIDNYKHGDSLRFPEGRIWYLLITLAIIWLTAWAFYREEGRGNIDKLFGLSQIILIGFSFASINFTNTYINLAGPVMLGIAYFTLARLYATATGKALEQNMVRVATARADDLQATLLLIRFDGRRNVIPDSVLEKIRLGLKRIGSRDKSVEVLSGAQRGLWGLFEKTIAISWVAAADDDAAQKAIATDLEKILDELQPLLRKFLLHVEGAESHTVHSGRIQGGEQAAAGWRALFAEALLKWEKSS